MLVLAGGCGGAPQIVDYAPEKGAGGVPTSSPIRIDFDRAVDRASVAARFSLQPAAPGRATWPSDRELLFIESSPLRTDTTYHVLLRAGYRSTGGGAADLDHTWYFRTEGPLQVTDSSPGRGERNLDPAAYLEVSFNHRINPAELGGGFRLSPAVPVQATVAAGDPYRVVVAPAGLLAPDTPYVLSVTPSVHDVDGNPLPKPATIAFHTGAVRPLHGWLTCIESPAAADPTAAGDLWMVDQNRLPRQLLAGPLLDYAWAPGADEVTVETAPRSWVDRRLDGSSTAIGAAADLVLPLGGGRGFVYFDQGTLGLLSAAGAAQPLVSGVTEIALSPDGGQVAYVIGGSGGAEIWVLTVELRSRYLLATEAGAVAELNWSPDASRVAYQLTTATGAEIRVRALAGAAAATVASGAVSAPAWDADSSHLYLLAATGSPAVTRLYRIPTGAGAQTLSPAAAMPAPAGLALGPPAPSPDGHQVAFAGTGRLGDEVWLMNSDGTGVVRLTGGPAYAYSCRTPRWTPPA